MYFVFPKAQPQSFSKLPLLTSSDYLMSSVVFVCVESCLVKHTLLFLFSISSHQLTAAAVNLKEFKRKAWAAALVKAGAVKGRESAKV